ncbi:MAG TPA: DUF3467 domain-containing protein [bacterium]|jgi:hypothetical protein|nr:DUF3467 domain-containing protein [bacterium]MDX9804320.1 DUF3467 domain-containing protein [bacterium]HNZ53574.1 DUF3467 domain-containing protein [bacterium]HOB70508.1 DUF3467 domain-containing protein [bacterium]HOG43700.1 DUF3467 domain-containing protein [bacterium]
MGNVGKPVVEGKNIQLKLKNDDVAAGNYSNSFAITFNENEFLIDFIMMQPQAQMGLVTDRIVVTPRKAAELAKALSDAVKAYENMLKTRKDNIQ